MMPKVSVIVPTVGDRKTEIIRLFESIVCQDYKAVEVVVVAQDNFDTISNLCGLYSSQLNIVYVQTNKKGLSRARNIGVKESSGEILLLSDDDCWYERRAIGRVVAFFDHNEDIDILLTQIYDPIANVLYKAYPVDSRKLTRPTELLSKSSIEIAYRRRGQIISFDELFGLGGVYVAGEENDFLIRSLKGNKRIQYEPFVTVYHEKKAKRESNNQLLAKGAFYSKNFGFVVSNIVLLRDLLKKHQNNYRWFWNGYFDYKKRNKRIH